MKTESLWVWNKHAMYLCNPCVLAPFLLAAAILHQMYGDMPCSARARVEALCALPACVCLRVPACACVCAGSVLVLC